MLILDGHTSRWNKAAMDLLLENQIFPFSCPVAPVFGIIQMTVAATRDFTLVSKRQLRTCVARPTSTV